MRNEILWAEEVVVMIRDGDTLANSGLVGIGTPACWRRWRGGSRRPAVVNGISKAKARTNGKSVHWSASRPE